ncbi:transmembrane protein 135-like isoform X1 [Onthophagus taurus]|uniref:transmembrane protein 135-like isoform X1 n=1 Tax=Onthophagus taurus TaxID=166361 RepID=UPI000C205821|nr:transmembrane protein 135-like isoform X2 [Onthophagus taurus]
MVQVLSKLTPIPIGCDFYVHPWTDSCLEATMGLYIQSIVYSLRLYGSVYLLALLMQGRVPRRRDIKKTILGILQSATFLSGTAFGYSLFLCTLRRLLGNFNVVTASFMPAFLSSVFAILIERPSRRTLLSLYVSNVATETIWNMLVYRNMVKPIPYGQVAIFAASISVLLTIFRSGLHAKEEKRIDPMFKILRFIIGTHEEKVPSQTSQSNTIHRETESVNDSSRWGTTWRPRKKKTNFVFALINQALRVYKQIINKIKCCDRHTVCPHPFSCLYYTIQGSTKMFSIGLSIQLVLKLVLNMQVLFKNPKRFSGVIFRRDTIKLASFLAGSCGIFRAISCLLRRTTGKDSSMYAIPAGLLAGVAFSQYPDKTIALYVMWKTLQIAYNLGIDHGYVPKVPGFNLLLYCFSTAMLFHVALLEPQNLRSSYWKFLCNISGGRVACMDRSAFEPWGLGTMEGLAQTIERTKTPKVVQFLGIKW